jgi:hypothetical protein
MAYLHQEDHLQILWRLLHQDLIIITKVKNKEMVKKN